MKLAMVLLSSLTLAAGAQVTDEDVQQAIEHDLMEEGIRAVEVSVSDSTVTLTGRADSLWEKVRAEELALDHDEVETVDNRISVPSDRGDEAIATDVANKLRNYVHYSIFDNVNVGVNNGVVTLTGDVTWGYKADEMAKMTRRVPGVREVENQIEVLPSSPNDQQLRQALASRIYGDSSFFRYSVQAVPPVHIVVKNGKVTLTGVVDTQIQKRRAESIARQTFGVFSVDNQLQVEQS